MSHPCIAVFLRGISLMRRRLWNKRRHFVASPSGTLSDMSTIGRIGSRTCAVPSPPPNFPFVSLDFGLLTCLPKSLFPAMSAPFVFLPSLHPCPFLSRLSPDSSSRFNLFHVSLDFLTRASSCFHQCLLLLYYRSFVDSFPISLRGF